MPLELVQPDWAAAAGVVAAMSTRRGGVSRPPFDSLNLQPPVVGDPAADRPGAVRENQSRFAQALGAQPVWLQQVHGADVVRLGVADLSPGYALHRADAGVTTVPGLACAVLVADCLPVLMCARNGRAVAAAHAGWRGLAAGVLERTLAALCGAANCASDEVLVWLGVGIGPGQFEVGADVLLAFGASPGAGADASTRFAPRPRPDGAPRWLADLPGLARDRLAEAGVTEISGASGCSVEESSRFFSFRRDGRTGRMAAAIAIGR